MQRYRVNYVLLIGLVVGFFAFSGAAYGLWKFQVNRNAVRLLEKAEVADKGGEIQDAFDSLYQYVHLRQDDDEAKVRLGQAAAKIWEDFTDYDSKTLGNAFEALTAAVRDTDDPGVRRKLVDVQVLQQLYELALANIEELLAGGHGDAKLKSLKTQCLFEMQKQAEAVKYAYQLIGYDQKTDEFDPAKAEAPDQPVVYASLAQYLRSNKQPELADRVLEKMIEANPESHEAYVLKYQLTFRNDPDAAREAIDKAYELNPTEAAVLNFKGNQSLNDYYAAMNEARGLEESERKAKEEEAAAHLEAAGQHFQKALELFPEHVLFYERLAQVELLREKPDQALAVVESGLKKYPLKSEIDSRGIPRAIALSNIKVDILIADKKFDAIKEEIKTLNGISNTQARAMADLHEARVAAASNKWQNAAVLLQRAKLRLLSFPDQQAAASAIQGFCYTQLGQLDLAREAYRWALEKNPNHLQAAAALKDIESALRISNEEEDGAPELDNMIREMIARPSNQQDWESVYAAIDQYIDANAATRSVDAKWGEARKALLRGQTFAMRAAEAVGDEAAQKPLFAEARKWITTAYQLNPSDAQIQMAAIRLLAQEPDSGPTKALALLDQVVAKNQDSAQFRALRIDILAALRDEQLPDQLNLATTGMEEWPAEQQAMVWTAAAGRFEQIGKIADAQRCLEKAAELAPNSLPTRMQLFDLALRQGDDDAMKKAQARILEVVSNESDPTYVLTEVKRRMAGQATGVVSKEQLQEARGMLEQALKVRPNWAELHVLSGQLYMTLEKKPELALQAMNKAIEAGGANYSAIAALVRLQAERGRLQEARQTMNRIPVQLWPGLLDRAGADILSRVGEMDRAFAEAERIAKARTEDAQTQSWFAQIALKARQMEAAEKAMQKAIELTPSDPDLWTRLVGLYIEMKRANDVERVLREAHLALDEEYLPLLSAKYYELQSRWQEAEDLYLAALSEQAKDNPYSSRRLAEFYMTWIPQDPANRGKAAVYLNRILRATYEGKLATDDPSAQWARRQAARLLSLTGDYQDSLKAERMLSLSAQEGVASVDDQEQLIDLISLRQDPQSRERVVTLLQEMKQQSGLSAERDLQLGHALHTLGRWDEAKAQMTDAMARHPDNLGVKTAYISMLITRKELNEAEQRILRLTSEKGAEAAIGELRLRLAAAKGQQDVVRQTLTAMTPDLTLLKEDQLKFLQSLAALAEEVGDRQYALDLMRQYARRVPGNELRLARLTALYGDLDEGLAMLQQTFESNIEDTMTVALEVLRARRAEAPEKLDEEVSRIIRRGLRDDPESANRMIIEAEVLEVQERYDESLAAYKKLLARDDVPKLMRATGGNNMAYIVALRKDDPAELEAALNAVNVAVEGMGPISDVLDTRALVHLSLEQPSEALADMKLAVKMNPTPSKFFHLAAAHLAAGDQQAAIGAWKRAQAEGIAPEKVAKLERDRLEEFSKKMASLDAAAPANAL